MGYAKTVFYGFSWIGAFRILTRGMAFVRIAILARLLTPTQFGVYGIAVLVLAGLEIFTETGINVVLIQEKKPLKEYLNTAWFVSIVRGVIIAFLILLIAPIAVRFFNSPQSLQLILLVSLVPLLRGFINPAIVKFQKELKFRKEFNLRTTIFLIDSIVSLVLAYITRSPIALVYGLIVGVVFEVLISFIFISPRPKLIFELEKTKYMITRGKWVTFAGIFEYLFRQGDDAVVGKILGQASLGIYQNAYKIATLPITEITHVVSKVTFPVFSKISSVSQKKRLRKAFYKTAGGVALLVIPIGIVLIIFSKEIVLIILGPQWTAAIPIIKYLAVFGMIRAMIGPAYSVMLASRKQNYLTVTTMVGVLAMAISIVPLTYEYGLIGVSISTIIGSIATVFPTVYYIRKVLKDPRKQKV